MFSCTRFEFQVVEMGLVTANFPFSMLKKFIFLHWIEHKKLKLYKLCFISNVRGSFETVQFLLKLLLHQMGNEI